MKFLTILIALFLFKHTNADCDRLRLSNGSSYGCLSEGGQYQFFCDRGFALIGPESRLCVNGNWTGTQPRCQISLGGPGSFADIRFDTEYGIIPSFHYVDTFYPTCWLDIPLELASIGCRQVGSGMALWTHRVDLEFGLEIPGPYLYATNLSCLGTESHISHCTADAVGLQTECSDGVLGISCEPYIRVRYNSVLDRMQLFYESWIDLCEFSLDQETADNYCRLEGKLGGAVLSSVNGSKVGENRISSVACSPEMKNFGDCVVTKVSTECRYLKIECRDTNIENSLRLTGSENLHTGKLQIYRGSSWGDVCYEAFYPNEATAACKQLGFEGYLAYPRGVYGDLEGDSYKVERVKCPLGAVNFSSCEFLSERRCDSPKDTVALWCINNGSCCLPVYDATKLKINSTNPGQYTHGEVLRFYCIGNTVISGKSSLKCESGKWIGDIPTCVKANDNSIRLIDGPNPNEGSIQIFLFQKWNFVCDTNFTLQTATNICEDFGQDGALEITKFNFYNSTPEQQKSFLECTNNNNNNNSCMGSDCTTNEIAGVVCGDLQFEAKFVGPEHNQTAGRVQVFYNGIWAEICSDFGSFFTRNGQTICRQLGFSYHSEYTYDEGQQMFGYPNSSVTISFLCYGADDNVGSCRHSIGICTQSGLYLACTPPDNGTVRLVGGTTSSQGIVEIYKDFSWQSLCTENWDMNDGKVVCRGLGWTGFDSINSTFGPAVSKIGFAITQIGCDGNESSLMECSYSTNTTNCDRNEPATVECSTPERYQVRLTETVEYDRNTSGLVEVYVGNDWIGVCDDEWGIPDATVVCRSLKFDYTIEALNSFYLISSDIGWNYVNCIGNETSLGECGYSNATISSYFFASCYRTEGAGVTCGNYVDYDVRINPDTLAISDTISGVVEIKVGNSWYPFCFDGTDISQYFCSQLNYGSSTGVTTSRNLTTLQSINDFNCSDTPLSECQPQPDSSTNCSSDKAVEINCINLEGRIRLVDGNASSGHVQVFFSSRWGDVCDDLWGIEDANVVCRQLGMKAALKAISYSTFGSRDYYFWLDNVMCLGTESRLADCPSNGWGQHNCGRYELAGVQCLPPDCPNLAVPPNTVVDQNVTHGGYAVFSCVNAYKLEGLKSLRCMWSNWTGTIPTCVLANEGDIQLVDGPTSYEGHVQIFLNNQWGYLCDDNWDKNEGIVVCRQLGYAPNFRGISISSFYPLSTNVSTIWLDGVQCFGNESQLTECQGANPVASLCSLKEIVGVQCYADEGSLRLYGVENERNGLLQIYENGIWHYFCNFEFIGGIGPACSQLGFQNTGFLTSRNVNTTDFKGAFCLYTDRYLFPFCQLKDVPDCFQNFAVNLTCTINDRCESRLSGNSYKGIVEFWRDGRWGGICKDGFTFREASIFCKQLGWSGGVVSVGYDVTTTSAIPFHFQSVTCDPAETELCNCTKDFNVNSTCIRDEAVYIECVVPADGTLRLIGGLTANTGILEIFHEGYWGSVCDDSWTGPASTVACKQLGYREYNSYTMRNKLTSSVWLDDVVCTGEELYLSNCSHNGWGKHNCRNLEGVMLDCMPYAETELLLTDKQYSNDDITARIQIRYNNNWYNICPYQITNAVANQLCLIFKFEGILNVSMSLQLDRPSGSSNDTVSLVACPLEFDNLTECLESGICPTDKVLGIKCRSLENQTRLITTNGFSGFLEINHEGIWRGICDDGWDIKDTTVACVQLGFDGAIRPLTGLAREDSSFWLSNVDCTGHERYIDHCEFTSWVVSNCYRNEYAGIVCIPHDCISLPTLLNGYFIGNKSHGSAVELVCSTDYTAVGVRTLECVNGKWIGITPTCELPQEFSLRLVDFDTEYFHTGHVQIYHSGKWGYICGTNWDNRDGAVACSQLGFEGFQQITLQSYHSNASGMAWTDNVNCHESDLSFAECGIVFDNTSNCSGNLAGVKCVTLEGHLELINGTTNGSGWVRIYKQGRYYPVCYSTFGLEEVSVACRQLGYPKGEKTESGSPGVTYSELTVDCTGNEESISECILFELGASSCYRHDTYIVCSHEVDTGYKNISLYSQPCSYNRYPRSPEDYTIRLIGGQFDYEGQLEVYLRGDWLSVCVPNNTTDLSGICNVLGWEYGVRNSSTGVALSNLGVQIRIVYCPNNSDNITRCELVTDNVTCTREQAVVLECRSPPENTLRRGYNDALEIYHNNRWGYVCDDLFDQLDATVACRDLGHPGVISYQIRIQVLSEFFWLDNLACTGLELSLADCKSNDFQFENCYSSEGVTVECTPNTEGSIKFQDDIPQIFLDDGFYYLCADGDYFTIHSGSVICLQEGLVEADSVGTASSEGLGYATKIMRCVGTESNVIECTYTNVNSSCRTVATVTCINPTGLIRLVQGTNTSGIIQIHNGTNWLYICPDRWSYRDADIACKQLGFNVVRDVSQTSVVSGDVVYYGSQFDCYGTESELIECYHIKTDICDEVGVATLACEDLTCPDYSSIQSCGSSCNAVCNEQTHSPIVCDTCEVKCECYSDYIWEQRPHTKCIRKADCPTYCTENESYHCVPACQFNCANYKQALSLYCRILSCTMGCGCKSGYVRKSGFVGECVLESYCEPRTTQSTVTQATSVSITITTPTPIACPTNSQYKECTSACPLNCSSISPVSCTGQCYRGCECDEGFVLLRGSCIIQTSCPVDGSVEIQETQIGAISGPLRLFSNGNWYNICSDGIETAFQYPHEFSCEYLNYTHTIERYFYTSYKPGNQVVRLECQARTLAVTQCNYTETSTCSSILNLACMEISVTNPIAGVVAGTAVILGLIAVVVTVLIVIAVIAVMMIRRKNQARSYKQFNARLSVVSEAMDDPPGIANPIYQTKDLETEQLITEDDDVLTN